MGRVRVRAAGSIRQAAGPRVAGASKISDHALPASGPAHATLCELMARSWTWPSAHHVEDPGERLAGHGNLGDVAGLIAAAGEDVLLSSAQRVTGGHVLDRFDQRPAHDRRPLFRDVAMADLGIGLGIPLGQPSPRAQPRRGGDPGDVADLGQPWLLHAFTCSWRPPTPAATQLNSRRRQRPAGCRPGQP